LDGGDECGRACVGGTVMTDFKDIGALDDKYSNLPPAKFRR